MTPEQLVEIRARAEAATPGPWMQGFPHRGQVAFGPGPNSMYAWTSERGQLVVGNAKVGADVRFVAHARTDIPALLDYIEELEAKLREFEPPTCEACGASAVSHWGTGKEPAGWLPPDGAETWSESIGWHRFKAQYAALTSKEPTNA